MVYSTMKYSIAGKWVCELQRVHPLDWPRFYVSQGRLVLGREQDVATSHAPSGPEGNPWQEVCA